MKKKLLNPHLNRTGCQTGISSEVDQLIERQWDFAAKRGFALDINQM